MKARAGLTLVEILVVLLILGVTAAVAAPGLARLTGSDAERAARRLGAVYRRARDAATVHTTTAAVRVDFATASYLATLERGPALAPDTLDAGILPLGAARLEGGRGGRAVATFDPLGRAWSDSLAVIEGDARYDVTVDLWTAEIGIRRQ